MSDHPVRRCPTTHPPWGGRLTTYPASALRVPDLTTHLPAGDTSHSDVKSRVARVLKSGHALANHR